MNINNLVRKNVQKLQPYSSARDEFKDFGKKMIYLDANENPFENGVNRYPDPHQKTVKQVLSEIKNISTENILLGNGSDEVLDLVFRGFCEPAQDNVIITPPTYGMYKVCADVNNVECREALLNEDFSLNTDRILAQIDNNTKVIFLCSPNNPTANNLSIESFEFILKNVNCLVVIDEAYIDFSTQPSWTSRLSEFPNLIVCQTLSKAYGMAGIRLGMAFANTQIIEVFKKIKAPYNVNKLTQEKAMELLADTEGYKNRLAEIISEREELIDTLKKLSFVQTIYPTDANFVLFKVDDANKRYNQLLDNGIVVRNRTKEPLCENCLRITIGTKEENNAVIAELEKLN